MKKTIVISPYSRVLRDGKENAKNYPYWEALIKLLHKEGYYIIQIGRKGEKALPVKKHLYDLNLKQIGELVLNSNIWISVDNFLPHLCFKVKKSGIVLWGKSDPNIFGYQMNTNLLKDRKYLRKLQFDIWEKEEYDSDVFVSPEIVLEAVRKYEN